MSLLHIEQPIKNLHNAKTPPNALGEFVEAMLGLAFLYVVFGGGFALATWLCATF